MCSVRDPIARLALAAMLSFAGAVCAQAGTGDADAALTRAIAAGDAGGLAAALAAHADPNRAGAFGAGPLALAVNAQDPGLVAALLKAGARPNIADVDEVTPLGLACELGNAVVVGELLDSPHVDIRAPRADGTTALQICARFSAPATVARLLALGALPDSVDARGQTPLMWAAAGGKADSVALLLKAGAGVNRVSAAGFTPLAFAIKSGDTDAVRELVAAGARTDWRGPEQTSALQLALYQKAWGAAALMLAATPDAAAALAERDREGHLPLHVAAANGEAALVSAMLAKGADANGLSGPSRITWVTEANFGRPPPPEPATPPLLMAAAHGHADVMAMLIAAGADPRFVASDGTNLVLAATKGGKAQALAAALALAPDANVANAAGMTPLHVLAGGLAWSVAAEERLAMLRLLAAHGARADIPSKPSGFGEKGKTETKGVTAAQVAADGVTEVRVAFQSVFPPAPARLAGGPAK
jgi:ankyrin repeat protein